MIGFSFTGVNTPLIVIKINGKIIFNNKVNGDLTLSFPIELYNNTEIILMGIGKRNNEDVANDKFLVINDVLIDQISMGVEWIKTVNTIENYQTNTIYNNGQICFTVTTPVLDWIITEKYIKKELQTANNETGLYSGLGRFNYRYIQDKIEIIKKLLND